MAKRERIGIDRRGKNPAPYSRMPGKIVRFGRERAKRLGAVPNSGAFSESETAPRRRPGETRTTFPAADQRFPVSVPIRMLMWNRARPNGPAMLAR